MKIDLLNRPRLEILNKRGPRYNLQDAEKDYFRNNLLGKFILHFLPNNVIIFIGISLVRRRGYENY